MNNSNIVLVPNFHEVKSVVELHESKRAKINTPKKNKLELTYNAFLENLGPAVETKSVAPQEVKESETAVVVDKLDEFSKRHQISPIVKDFNAGINVGARKIKVAGILPPKIENYCNLKSVEIKKEEHVENTVASEAVATPVAEKVEVKVENKVD